jgi:O-antigen/teichoic acid export membrane protein
MHRLSRLRADLLALVALIVLPILWFAPVLFTGKTLLPYDNLYTFEPWRSLRPDLIPHNSLLSDLVLENAVWKLHIHQALANGQIPLWNPQIFTGIPFFAAGQASVAYPLSLLFYILPLEVAYGWFTALQLAIAGINLYLFGRVLRLRPVAALFSGVVFQFSGFMIVSVVFTMVIAAASWLPLVLAIIEYVIQKQEEKGSGSFRPVPYVVAGAAILGVVALAGHPEFFYYTLLVAGLYTTVRLLVAWRRIAESGDGRRTTEHASRFTFHVSRSTQHAARIMKLGGWILALALLGIAAGAVQLIPLYELVTLNFREGSASLQQVVGWAWPNRHLLTFFLPDIFGNPSHHTWLDLWNRQWQPATVNALGEPTYTIFWGIKNYVEGGNYVGLLTWILAGVAVITALGRGCADARMRGDKEATRRRTTAQHATRNTQYELRITDYALRVPTGIFTGLAILSLLFAFGTPLYAILFYGLPGWNQLHSPFRWVFPFTISMALLGGIGLERLLAGGMIEELRLKIGRWTLSLRSLFLMLSILFVLAGVGALVMVVASYFLPGPFIHLGQRIVNGSDLAQGAFADGRMFWGYQSVNLIKFGLFALLSGAVVWGMAKCGCADVRMCGNVERVADHGPQMADDGLQTTDDGQQIPNHVCALPRIFALLATAIVALDLFSIHGTFNPATDPALSPLHNVPPVVEFINARERGDESTTDDRRQTTDGGSQTAEVISSTEDANAPLRLFASSPPRLHAPAQPFRFTTFDVPGAKTFNANMGMYYGWQDIRGYDSIIPRQYVELMDQVADQHGELLYNRIAPLYADGPNPYAVLENPLLDLLNVKYVITEYVVPNAATWEKIYEDGVVKVYENREVMPRTFIVPQAEVRAADEQPLLSADLRQTVFVEQIPSEQHALSPASAEVAEARISRYTGNDVFVDINLSDRGWLVLTDAYFPGWKAYLRPFGGDEGDETELTIYRANSAFRSVYLPEAGQWTVRFVYSPMSFKLGLYVSFLVAMACLLLLLWWAWGRYYRPVGAEDEVGTVAKNSLVPMGMNLANKAIDFAFAMLYVRMLGPTDLGKYAFVVTVYGFFEIVSRYGLGTLLTRDVAADKSQSSRYLTNVLGLRTVLWLVSMPVLALVTFGYWVTGSIGAEEVQAIVIFGVAMLFANWADGLSNLFYAFEKMEYPAGLSSAIALLKVTFGALALLMGWGFVGLAWVSLAMNILQTIWLYALVRSTLLKPEWRWDFGLQRWMFSVSGPLMINHLLATIFWRIDVWILQPLVGAFSVGLYSASLKYLDGLNIIPSTFTFAIFPLMSRYAKREGEGLLRSYVLSVRLLLMVSLPLAMTITLLAEPLIYVLGGVEFLHVPSTVYVMGREISYVGGSALALQVIIWSIPIGFVNSVTQFVLIAVNQQRYLTKAFIIGVVFNVVGNLLLIPRFDYIGAAVVTILSEFSLLIPFYWSVRRHVGVVPWVSLVWRPVLAVAAMGITMVTLIQSGVDVWFTLIPGWFVYLLILALAGGFKGEDMAIIGRALPIGRLRRLLPA